MKKIFYVLFFLLLMGCSRAPEEPDPEMRHGVRIVLDASHIKTATSQDLLLFNDNYTFYTWSGMDPTIITGMRTTPHRTSHTASHHIEGMMFNGSSVVFDAPGNLFVALAAYGDVELQQIIRFNMNRHDDNVVVREITHSGFVDFYIEGGSLIVFEHLRHGSSVEYVVTYVNLADNSEHMIISKTFSSHTNTGEVMPSIFVRNGRIYTYRFTVDAQTTRHYMDIYDFDGVLQDTFALEIDDFLYMQEVNKNDAVSGLSMYNNIIILTTVSGRTAMLCVNTLEEIYMPNSFRNINGPMLLSNFSEDSRFLYFFDHTYERLYMYCPIYGRFYSFYISVEDEYNILPMYERIIAVHRDIPGNIVVHKQVDVAAFYVQFPDAGVLSANLYYILSFDALPFGG